MYQGGWGVHWLMKYSLKKTFFLLLPLSNIVTASHLSLQLFNVFFVRLWAADVVVCVVTKSRSTILLSQIRRPPLLIANLEGGAGSAVQWSVPCWGRFWWEGCQSGQPWRWTQEQRKWQKGRKTWTWWDGRTNWTHCHCWESFKWRVNHQGTSHCFSEILKHSKNIYFGHYQLFLKGTEERKWDNGEEWREDKIAKVSFYKFSCRIMVFYISVNI